MNKVLFLLFFAINYIQLFSQNTLPTYKCNFIFNCKEEAITLCSSKFKSDEFKSNFILLLQRYDSIEQNLIKYKHKKLKFHFIPTLSLENCEILFDTIFLPLEVYILYKNKYIGHFNNNINEYGKKDKIYQLNLKNLNENWDYASLDMDNHDTKRYNKVYLEDIAKKIEEINPKIIFKIRDIYHTYFYVKKGKMYSLFLPLLRVVPVEEFDRVYEDWIIEANSDN